MEDLATLLDSISVKRLPRDYLGCSQIGHPCDRKLWMDMYAPAEEEISSRQRRIFKTGELFEILVKEELSLLSSQITIDHWQVPLSYPPLKGTADAILKFADGTRVLLEIKSMNDRNFKKLLKNGSKIEQFQYWAQCQSYMGMAGLKNAILLVGNKNEQTFYSEIIPYEDSFFLQMIEKANRLKDAKIMPLGMTALSRAHYTCTFCPYNKVCWNKEGDVHVDTKNFKRA